MVNRDSLRILRSMHLGRCKARLNLRPENEMWRLLFSFLVYFHIVADK